MPTVSNDKHGYLTELKLYSAHALITEPGRYFKIPEQQRQFSWDENTINRLIEDIVKDMKRRMIKVAHDIPAFDRHAVSFIGTVVCCKETSDHAYAVIDGQQRLTVFMILSIILHDYINDSMSTISESNLKKQCAKINSKLEVMIEQHHNNQEDFRPRMIRESEDIWPGQGTSAQYKSPISHYVSHYGKYCRELRQSEAQKFLDYYNQLANENEQMAEDHRYKQFGNAVNNIKNKIDGICKHDSKELHGIEKNFSKSRQCKR